MRYGNFKLGGDVGLGGVLVLICPLTLQYLTPMFKIFSAMSWKPQGEENWWGHWFGGVRVQHHGMTLL